MTVSTAESLLEDFAEKARVWLVGNVPREWLDNRGGLSEDEVTSLRMEWDKRLYRGGYAGLAIATEFGGRGLGLAEEVTFAELAARAHAPDGFGRIGRILVAPTLIALGSDEQRRRYLPPILRGAEIWCQGFSEPGAGSDLASVTTQARRVEGGYMINGAKIWTSFARQADRSILLARTDPEAPRHRNLSMFMVDMKQPGVQIRPIKQISGVSHFAEVFLDDVFVADSDRIAEEGDGWTVAMTVLSNERGTIEAISRYVEIRGDVDLLSQCCASDPEHEHLVADLSTRLELVRWQVWKALGRQDKEAAYWAATSVLKVMWSELWQEICALGLLMACPSHESHWRFSYLETRAATIYSGSSEIQRNVIGDRVLGLPR